MASNAGLLLGEHVWIAPEKNGEFDVAIGGIVKLSDSGQIIIVDDEGQEHWLNTKDAGAIKTMHPSSIQGVQDMIQLDDLHEAGMLHNLYIRYYQHNIYTYTGSILVAVNPYQLYPIYNAEYIQKYQNQKIGELPPHIFAVADNAYRIMMCEKRNQCLLVSGESGAGKTESTKLILQFLAAVSGQHSWIEQQILEANPIMEAFGNAKTVRNDNSSRFGKYIDVYFDKYGVIKGAKIEQYLLEKSRIVYQMDDERNYHIFYRMLAGMKAEEKERLGLTCAEDYYYLTQGDCTTCPDMDEAEEFAIIRGAMKVLYFTDDHCWQIFKLLAAILHFGNLELKPAMSKNLDATIIEDGELLETIALLLEVPVKRLVDALTVRSTIVCGERIYSPLSAVKSVNVRDALVKGIYGKVFVSIISKINAVIYEDTTATEGILSIGVLDIFGFENFGKNSFEQLCINYANENIQQFFVRHIFKLEQDHYDQEGIKWQHISFVDNQDILDMLGQKPMNIISLIDEESRFPKGTDQTMLNKLVNNHGTRKNGHFVPALSQSDTRFGINHFAGLVTYESNGFLDKNRDSFNADLLELVLTSKSDFLYNLFSGQKAKGDETRKRSPSLGAQFKKSLDSLMKTLQACHPFFVRCIKPNNFKKPMMFDRELCCRQLRYSGMMETIKIRRQGYPIRHKYDDFVHRYYLLLKGMTAKESNKKKATKTIVSMMLPNEDWQMGKTKIFLKDVHNVMLGKCRDMVMTKQAVVIQKVFRGYCFRKRFLQLKFSAVVVQRVYRARIERLRFIRLRRGIARLQAVYRAQCLSNKFNLLRERLIILQSFCRGYICRVKIRQRINAVVTIQTGWRRVLAKQKAEAIRRQRKRKLEAERIAREEEKRLRHEKGKKAAKREAEKLYNERIHVIEQSENEMNLQRAREAKEKTEHVMKLEESAKIRREQDVNDSTMIDEIFGYLGENDDQESETSTSYFQDLEINQQPKIASDHMKMTTDDHRKDEDLSQYVFSKFASTYFQSATHAHIKQNLRQPLLPMAYEGDSMSCLAIWITILRFMNDMPEPKDNNYTKESGERVMKRIYDTLGRRSAGQRQNEDDSSRGTARKRLATLTLKRKSKITKDVTAIVSEDNTPESHGPLSAFDKPTSNLKKLHFIIGHGILRPELRDEIYCQICKQLTENPNKVSHARGWILLSLCVGCFCPTEKLFKYLRNFIRNGPPDYAPYCEERLLRTRQNGTRKEPPSWLELRATKSKKQMILPIAFMDGTTKTLYADSATTAKELCEQLAEKANIASSFGFSIYISVYEKFASLGSNKEHVMDAISYCEQYAKEFGKHERDAPWRLIFRKEIFSPWDNSHEDIIATNLIYKQIVRGVKFEEYKFSTEEELAELAAIQCYIDLNQDFSKGRFNAALHSYIPDKYMQTSSGQEKWRHLVEDAYSKNKSIKDKVNAHTIKGHVVETARLRWSMLFSRFYEANQLSGSSLAQQNIIIAVNWTGVYVLNKEDSVLLELQFAKITGVLSNSDKTSFTISTIKGEDFTFTSTSCEDIIELITYFLDGLRARSKYVVAKMDCDIPGENTNFLSFKKNDLIVLQDNETGASFTNSEWCKGLCERTDLSGDLSAESVYVLPILSKPTADIMAQFEEQSKERTEEILSSAYPTLHLREKDTAGSPYTLEEYSKEHFTVQPARAVRRVMWAFQKEPIKQPLLQRLIGKEDLSYKATQAFLNILKFMGDYPSKRTSVTTELTDEIFEPPLNSEPMRDEIYCQIIKQLTANKISTSEKRGWQLMWLCTGLFACSNQLLKYVISILKSWMEIQPIAKECILRLQKTIRIGQRKYPPHFIEVEACKRQEKDVYHRIYFPNNGSQACKVDSGTKAKDLCASIAQNLRLNSYDGFSLFVQIADKVISVPEGDFFFDFISHLMKWLKKTIDASGTIKDFKVDANPSIRYQVFFMKKLWTNTIPGKDPAADCIFHYHQELPKYLRGYHKCSSADATQLAALIYRVKFGNDKSQFSKINQMLDQLIPKNVHSAQGAMTQDNWKRAIVAAYNKHQGKTQNEAKISFLKIIYRWPTFGSAFFEVKQTTEPRFPEFLIIVINKNGASLIHKDTKEILETYPFSKISNWSSGNTYFHMTIGSLVKGSKFLCETSLGYKMDDLLTSYLSTMLTNINKGNPNTVVSRRPVVNVYGENTNFLSFKKNDLIILQDNETGASFTNFGCCKDLCERTDLSGDLSADVMAQFEEQSKERKEEIFSSAYPTLHLRGKDTAGSPYTLEEYSKEHFTVQPAQAVRQVMWAFQKKPIKQPLLQRLIDKKDLSYKATQAFLNILKFMGDYPSKRTSVTTELTDEIFEPPLNSEPMRDEIYCQIIKQLTANKISTSEKRGWQLMWLCTGLFACSNQLLKYVISILKSWMEIQPIAKECILRLQKTIRIGQRKYPPHFIEVEACKRQEKDVYHRIYFPNNESQACKVDSGTKAKDLCASIAQNLRLNSYDGFSLFAQIADKVISVPEGDFFFDFISHWMKWLKKTIDASGTIKDFKVDANPSISYQVFFMKKLWTNTIPGKDPAADCIFHYHQELPKYLRGYHKCSSADATQLAALIYRVKFGNDKSQFSKINQCLIS
ncbi:myosin-VIIa-like [Xenia sp. Carnegie-2017]|uniref:myosin-VIIa-like n=1 Tax=Xenia sp. Carnegie-2017 TaxID=2897299 RepID=UPI001F0500DC|nr:myosin-VIIa-like [Xenia sp. Carnegie-2017]